MRNVRTNIPLPISPTWCLKANTDITMKMNARASKFFAHVS